LFTTFIKDQVLAKKNNIATIKLSIINTTNPFKIAKLIERERDHFDNSSANKKMKYHIDNARYD